MDHNQIIAELCPYLIQLSRALEAALGPSLRGVWLTGSTAVGAYRQGLSDVDVMVIASTPSRAQLDRVVAACAHPVLPCPARKLELVIYEGERWVLNFNTGANDHHVGFDPAAEPAHWFVIDRAFAARHARALVGSAPIVEPTHGELERAFDQLVDWYERNEPDAAEVARMRADYWRRTGEFATKSGGTLGEAPP